MAQYPVPTLSTASLETGTATTPGLVTAAGVAAAVTAQAGGGGGPTVSYAGEATLSNSTTPAEWLTATIPATEGVSAEVSFGFDVSNSASWTLSLEVFAENGDGIGEFNFATYSSTGMFGNGLIQARLYVYNDSGTLKLRDVGGLAIGSMDGSVFYVHGSGALNLSQNGSDDFSITIRGSWDGASASSSVTMQGAMIRVWGA